MILEIKSPQGLKIFRAVKTDLLLNYIDLLQPTASKLKKGKFQGSIGVLPTLFR